MLRRVALSLLLAAAPFASVGRAAPSVLVDVGASPGPSVWVAGDGARFDADGVVLEGGAIRSPRPVGGDCVVRLRGTWGDGAPALVVDLGQGIRATLAPAPDGGRVATLEGPTGTRRAGVGATPAFAVELRQRGRWFQLFVDGVPGPDAEATGPLPAGVIRVSIDGGAATLDRARVERLAWRDEAEVVGADDDRIAALAARPLADPEFRIAVAGEPTPITVRHCGARRDAEEIPLLEQGLALAGIRAWLSPRLLQGAEGAERVVEGETPFGPFEVSEERVVFVCDALLGLTAEWPSLTLWELEKDRIVDRTVPGGPMGRGIECVVPPGVSRLKLVLARPGRPSVEHEIVLHRK